ncbi:MAG: arylsulfatase [Verrucomicrobiales bacterium]|nr:arylsulfatase [Verrucomicrobiales bacterium]|tara:strand:- start:3735 stop:5414 length:1680 start_codon:yes stop_codon:yes gene_type:complete
MMRLPSFLIALACLWPTLVSAADRPNIVLVMTDDQGIGDVGIHGNDVIRTPRLDLFAQNGIRMDRFYVEPVCAPTRASLMTGRSYYRTGVIHTSRGGAKMSGDEETIAELLKAGGYRTGIFGKWHLGDNYPMRPQDQGFEETLIHKSGGIGQTPDKPNSYFNPHLWHNGRPIQAAGYCTDVFFDAAIEFIERERANSFFVYLSLNAPHTPLEIDRRYTENYTAQGLNETTARVYGMVENIDDNFGRLLDRLDDLNLREDTLVIFMTDNGAQQSRFNAGFRGRKSHTYEGGIRVPFFVQWPSGIGRKLRTKALGAHIDIAPTMISAAGISTDGTAFDGKNLLSVWRGTEKPTDRRLFLQCHRGLQPRKFQNCAIVSQRYKLVGGPGLFGKENVEGELKLELYDLEKDPAEKNDLAASKPDVLKGLKSDYLKWFDDVSKSRVFKVGTIHIGNPAENPVLLCRYQDSRYVDGKPTGWPVKIEQAGRYRLSVELADRNTGGRIHVAWQGKSQSRPVLPGTNSASFSLTAGEGLLDIWFQQDDKPRESVTNNGTIGNVVIEYLR